MTYESFTTERFFTAITTEAEARVLLWHSRFQGKELHCPQCHSEQFYTLATRPEVRTCKGCRRQLRLRAGTIFEASKTSLLLWVKALFYVMQGKRGMSAQELQRHLGLKSYGRVWSMLQKIRAAVQHRDAGYQVGDGVIELDAGTFGRRERAINSTSSWPLRPKRGWMPKGESGVERALPRSWWARNQGAGPTTGGHGRANGRHGQCRWQLELQKRGWGRCRLSSGVR